MVESGSEVLDCLPRQKGPVSGGRLPLDCEAAILDLLRRSRFTLGVEGIGAVVLEGPGFPAERLDMFYAPQELPLR